MIRDDEACEDAFPTGKAGHRQKPRRQGARAARHEPRLQGPLSPGPLAAWEISAAVLQEIDPDEVELLPAIVETVHAPAGRIEGVPGAFEFDLAQINSVAMAVFGAALVALKSVAPKLFDAAVDISKDAIKKVIDKKIDAPAPTPAALKNAKRIHEIVSRERTRC